MDPEASWLIEAVKGLGIAGGPVFAFLWWLERMERRSLQKEGKDYLVQMLTLSSKVETAVAKITEAVTALSATSRDEVETLKHLVHLVTTLSKPK